MKPDLNRRRIMLAAGAWLLAGRTQAAPKRLEPTPAQTAGPFYPTEPPLEDDSDLTQVQGGSGVAQGRITDLSGRLLDRNGQPIRATRIEIWQCDATGRYHHPRDRGDSIDPNFQGFGHTRTDEAGRYRFRTIRPVPYPGRTPHIHFGVFPEGERPFFTQLYIRHEPRNIGDFIFTAIPAERRSLVLTDFIPTPGNEAELAAHFDLVLAVTPRG